MPSLYIVLEQSSPDIDPFVSGKALSQYERELDDIARRLSVVPLMEFFSIDPGEAADMIESLGGDATEIEFAPEAWHEAGMGLASVRALRQYAQEHPEAVPGAGVVQKDLAEFERVLQSAHIHGIRWHLAVDT